MSAPAVGTTAHLDLAGAKGIPFWRLLAVEMRKAVDTRATRWLLVAMLGLSAAIMVGMALKAPDEFRKFSTLWKMGMQIVALLLPVVGILATTSEWKHRSALTTFALEPRRIRVFLAKMFVVLGLALAATLLGLVMAALATVIAGTAATDKTGLWTFETKSIALYTVFMLINVLVGFALGMLLSNSAIAITVYYIAPVVTPLIALWDKAKPVMDWVSQTALATPFQMDTATNEQWQQSAVAALVWIVTPLIIGGWLGYRREVK
ncbi:ABC transporter permease [Austwickia chelonae]|uniref:ABC transporter permease n=1 Tax=Austwickia chelonae TaxID=100225 RepID=UPI000E2691BF|nr:ABC transporter permease [Austwickia chelonae]